MLYYLPYQSGQVNKTSARHQTLDTVDIARDCSDLYNPCECRKFLAIFTTCNPLIFQLCSKIPPTATPQHNYILPDRGQPSKYRTRGHDTENKQHGQGHSHQANEVCRWRGTTSLKAGSSFQDIDKGSNPRNGHRPRLQNQLSNEM